MSENTVRIDVKRQIEGFCLDAAFEASGGVTGLIGPSGAGKTMILEAVAGLVRPQLGRISVGDHVFFDRDAGIFLPPEKRRIGYVFQEPRLFPHMTVAENLDYGARRRAAVTDRDVVVHLLGIEKLLDRYPHHLSGGEAARISIGRVLLSKPDILLMDEPLANLDMARRSEILPYIAQIHSQLGLPCIYVSHNIDEIVRLADKVIVLAGGQIAAQGDVASVLSRVDIQKLILGVAEGENDISAFVEAIVEQHDGDDCLSTLMASGAKLVVPRVDRAIGSRIRVKIRAMDVSIATSRPEKISIRNIIPSRIVEIEDAGSGHAFISLQAQEGFAFKSRITSRSVRELDLKPGDGVWSLVKSVALAG